MVIGKEKKKDGWMDGWKACLNTLFHNLSKGYYAHILKNLLEVLLMENRL